MKPHDVKPNPLSLALCDHLGLDPNQVSVEGIQVNMAYGSHIMLRWSGFADMTVEEFREVYESVEWPA